jgi:glycosyltransferase involved in cell wall biosynthesis
MKDISKRVPVAAQIRKGLEEAIRHAKGEITLKTTTLELPDRPPEVDAQELIELRLEGGMSQAVFALLLNVSTKTVQSWEQGNRQPSQAALRLIQVYRQNPNGLLELVGISGPIETPGNEKPANRGDLRSGEGRGQETRAQRENGSAKRVVTLFMAAVAGEVIKGFRVAHEACRILSETRSDFELVVTFDPAGPIDEFTRSVGWCSQGELPGHYRAADICLVPTIAQDALSITSVEAMAAGRAVIASRIGGLPYTVSDGLTGLLFEPGNAFDLAEKIGLLLDEPRLRNEMGMVGRRRFEADFMWPDVIKRYWRPLFLRRASVR